MNDKRELIESIYPLTPLQQGMLFHAVLRPEAEAYLIQMHCRLRGQFREELCRLAWQHSMDAHPTLRTAFVWENAEEPVQVVWRSVNVPFEVLDWSQFSAADRQARFRQFLEADRKRGFDLAKAPLIRIHLIREAVGDTRMVITLHHLLIDGWSLARLLAEVQANYAAQQAGGPMRSARPRPFRDYVLWLRAQDATPAREFWERRLAGFLEPTSLGIKLRNTRTEDYEYGEEALSLTPELTSRLVQCGRQWQVTLNCVVQSAWLLILSRYSGRADVLTGVTLNGRPGQLSGVEEMIGLFINTLPLRLRVDESLSVRAFVQAVQAALTEITAFQFVSLAEIQKCCPTIPGSNLFDHIFVFENYRVEASAAGPADASLEEIASYEPTHYPLTCIVEPGTRLTVRIQFNRRCYADNSIRALLQHFHQVLEQWPAAEQVSLCRVSLLAPEERRRLIEDRNATTRSFAGEILPHRLFEEQARRHPDRLAAVFESASMTYAELDGKANQLARYLRRQGAGAETLIGILLHRSLDVAVAVLGILKAGAAYVPLDPGYPRERLAFMMRDTAMPILLTQASLLEQVPVEGVNRVCLDRDGSRMGQESAEPLANVALPDNLLYIIYTSGSTGTPKGTALSHGALGNLIRWQMDALPPLAGGILQFASLSFDASFHEMFAGWAEGAAVYFISEELRHDLGKLIHYVGAHPIQRVILPVVVLQHWADEYRGQSALWQKVREVITTGEQLQITPAIIELFERYPHLQLHNHYGPAEAHVVTALTLEPPAAGWPAYPSIGRPIANVQCYILDQYLNPVPEGVTGELYLAGANLGRDYHHRADLTGAKFMPNPFSSVAGARMYRTGDLALYFPDGSIAFLGRADQQVKIRGFRVEPGEIEAMLGQLPGIQSSAVVVRGQGSQKQLIAYLVSVAGATVPGIAELRAHLLRHVPDFMVPAIFVPLSQMPLTTNGKIDRRRLPEPTVTAGDAPDRTPRTLVEQLLAGIWMDVLKLGSVGVREDFFELGGHSLTATQVVSRMRQVFEQDYPLRVLFDHPTLHELALAVEGHAGKRRFEDLCRRGLQTDIPLSFAQKRLWLLEQLHPGGHAYHLSGALVLKGALKPESLAQSLRDIVARHEILRLRIEAPNGIPRQQIHALPARVMELTDLTHTSPAEARAAAQEMMRRDSERPFEFASAPLFRFRLIRIQPDECVLSVVFHHLVWDGWSLQVFLRELETAYAIHTTGKGNFPELPIGYSDYAAWQNRQLENGALQPDLDYFKQALREVPPLNLPLDFPRPARRQYRGESVRTVVGEDLSAAIRAACVREKVTPFMMFLGGFALLLSRYSGQTDFALGSPVSGRNHERVESLLGCFLNTLVFRAKIDTHAETRAFLRDLRKSVLAAFAHQEAPFELVVDELGAARDLSRSPVFQVMLVYQEEEPRLPRFEGLDVAWMPVESRTAKFDLTLFITPAAGRFIWDLEFDADLFGRGTIEQMTRHLLNLLRRMVDQPHAPIADLTLLDDAERKCLLRSWQGPQSSERWGTDLVVHRFEHHARLQPELPAIVFRNQVVTYAELNQRANQLACWLRRQGMGAEKVVGIFTERSVETVWGILGVLKAGAAFLPLDIHQPAARLEYQLRDAACEVVLCQAKLLPILPTGTWRAIVLDQETDWLDPLGQEKPRMPIRPEQLAYVIYTSGSTGRPKGCQIEHRHLRNYLQWVEEAYFQDNSAGDFALYSNLAFDLTITSLFTPLTRGRVLHIFPPELSVDEILLRSFSPEGPVDAIKLTPAHITLLASMPVQASRIQVAVVGGEQLTAAQIQILERFHPHMAIYNEYGPTEATVGCVVKRVKGTDPKVLIGRPIDGFHAYVLDEKLNPSPTGVPGELFLGGHGVCRGYRNNSPLTAAAFLPDPYHTEPGRRLYRTGDYCRWNTAGDLEYLGRGDRQAQVRGHRVELGEVEGAILESGAASAVAVVYRDGRLIGYWQPQAGVGDAEEKLRRHLKERLPGYMIPSLLGRVEALPLTTNGKVDWARLPEAAPAPARPEGSPKVGARTEPERKLVALWEEVLGTREIGVEDNFFELGGDSILSIQVVARARRQGLALSAQQIFEHPTIAELARVAGELGAGTAEPSWRGPIGLTPIQRWFFALGLNQPSHWNQSVMLKVPGEGLREEPLRQAVAALVRRHEMLRARFWLEAGEWRQEVLPEGPEDVLWVREAESPEALRQVGEQAQTSLSLTEGRVFRALYVRWPGGPDRLLLVGHHLVVDGVSWRVLVEDLARGYEQASCGEAVRLEEGGASYGRWSQGLASYGTRAAVAAERARWREVARQRGDVPLDREGGANQVGSERGVSEVLEAGLTEQLLKGSWRQQGVSVDELLLSALALTLTEWNGDSGVKVDVEGHGRDEAVGVEVSRTVGWFTAIYPLWLERRGGVEATVLGVREARRSTGNGLGYGVLTYLAGGLGLAPGEARPSAVSFNYLGQVEAGQSGRFELGEESEGGAMKSPAERREYVLEVGANVSRGQLEVHWSYSEDLHERQSVAHWARRYMDKLREILACQPKAKDPATDPVSAGEQVQLSAAELAEIESLLANPKKSDS